MDFVIPTSEEDGARFLTLETMADVCLRKDEIFVPASQYDTFREDVVSSLFAHLEEDVTGFQILEGSRVYELILDSQPFYFWAEEGELPNPVIEVHEFRHGQKITEWGIGHA